MISVWINQSQNHESPLPVFGSDSISDTLIQVSPASPAEIGSLSCLAAGSAMKPSGEVNREYMVV